MERDDVCLGKYPVVGVTPKGRTCRRHADLRGRSPRFVRVVAQLARDSVYPWITSSWQEHRRRRHPRVVAMAVAVSLEVDVDVDVDVTVAVAVAVEEAVEAAVAVAVASCVM